MERNCNLRGTLNTERQFFFLYNFTTETVANETLLSVRDKWRGQCFFLPGEVNTASAGVSLCLCSEFPSTPARLHWCREQGGRFKGKCILEKGEPLKETCVITGTLIWMEDNALCLQKPDKSKIVFFLSVFFFFFSIWLVYIFSLGKESLILFQPKKKHLEYGSVKVLIWFNKENAEHARNS